VAAILASREEQVSRHPASAEEVYREWLLVGGPLTGASIPIVRAEAVRQKLHQLGLAGATPDFPSWEEDLRRRGRVGFVDDGEAFLPTRNFLEFPFLNVDPTVTVALQLGPVRDLPPLSLDADGSFVHGVAFDRYRQIARAVRAASRIGVLVDPRTRPDRLGTFGVVLVAFPVWCGDRVLSPVSIDLSASHGPPPRRDGLFGEEELAQLVPGFWPPPGALAGLFALTSLRPGHAVDITYDAEACPGHAREVSLPVHMESPRITSSPPPPVPRGVALAQPPVLVRAVIDQDGQFRNPVAVGGPWPLRAAAVSALQQWRAEPARLNGSPVVSDATLVVRFQ
jgi:hypothetical protein